MWRKKGIFWCVRLTLMNQLIVTQQKTKWPYRIKYVIPLKNRTKTHFVLVSFQFFIQFFGNSCWHFQWHNEKWRFNVFYFADRILPNVYVQALQKNVCALFFYFDFVSINFSLQFRWNCSFWLHVNIWKMQMVTFQRTQMAKKKWNLLKKKIMEFPFSRQSRTKMERNGMGFVWTQSEATHIVRIIVHLAVS